MSVTFAYQGQDSWFWALDDIVVNAVPSCSLASPCQNEGRCVQTVCYLVVAFEPLVSILVV
jgi:hypothetical protein